MLSEDAAKLIKADFMAKTTGDRRGEPLVTQGAIEIESFGFSPEQMQLRSIRGIPEERITAVLGVNAAVVGLGAGLATTKVGATLREYREEAFESTIIPMYRELGSELTHQLLDEFKDSPDWRLVFDLSKVRVLQDDENKRTERLGKALGTGGITVAEYRRALGYIALPEHDVYLRSRNVVAVPAGTSPEDQAAQSASAPAAATNAVLAAAMEEAVRDALEGARP
jgi:phage portal protein BeeE